MPQIKERLQTALGWRDKLSIYALLATRALVIVMFAVLLVGGFTFFFGEDNAPVTVVVAVAVDIPKSPPGLGHSPRLRGAGGDL